VVFHASHKALFFSHSPGHYARPGQGVAAVAKAPRAERLERDSRLSMQALWVHATPRKHVNVLHPIMGFFTGRLDARGNGIRRA
jgi:uncharacterized protein YbgA (DUF1722 family)